LIEGRIYRADTEACILQRVWRANTAFERMQGLLGRPQLASGEGLLLAPCNSVHTIGMRYPLDLIYLSAGWQIIKQVNQVPPWRFSACLRARMVLELAAGSITQLGLENDMQLRWENVA
jgi:uncharacterized protein